ncbi:hypothetical protein HPB48_011468 [Haemaphysalis longicornis]|uniref:Reverse transcriptase n=1 Tax=Haemaphysalis longicornis TaxID=44386 RepID=A0A9J6GSY3_HAELO|nr:hypothetical protein HPB48_011468 [Haemaphysalis longicornis]
MHIKTLMHLPTQFPRSHIWLPSRNGGLGTLQLERVAQAGQFKSLCRLLRLGDPVVDVLFEEILGSCHARIASVFEVPVGITDPKSVDAALKRAAAKWWTNMRDMYTNKDLFAHSQQQRANAWLYHDSKLLNDRDRIRALRLRTNLAPTRTLYNKHASDPAARDCRRCGERPETAFHILQEFEVINLSRQERHNFVSRQIARLAKEKVPGATVTEEKVFMTKEGVRLKPDLVLQVGEEVVIVDVAVTWDSNEGILKQKCKDKVQKYSSLKGLFSRSISVHSWNGFRGTSDVVSRDYGCWCGDGAFAAGHELARCLRFAWKPDHVAKI